MNVYRKTFGVALLLVLPGGLSPFLYSLNVLISITSIEVANYGVMRMILI